MRSDEFKRHRKAQEVLEQSLAKAADQILAELGGQQGALAVALLEQLRSHTPIAYLQSWSAGELVPLVREFFRFLDQRSGAIKVGILPAREGRGPLLLTNSLDAPFLVDSIQLALRRLNQEFQVVTHPILAVTRESGRLQRLGGLKASGERESFIVIELEDYSPEIGRAHV